ncbi:MAG: hypothetical protein KBS35_00755 [Mycoplasma sp.]|nr:hypothetical protein [Candidatus Hennigella equi]
MIKQNIKVALLVVLGLITFWLVILSFIKIDISAPAIVTYVDTFSYVAIDTKSAAYIENHALDYIKMEYEKQYFSCHITFSSSNEQYSYYLISLPDIVDKSRNYLDTTIIIDSLNIYQYLLKK